MTAETIVLILYNIALLPVVFFSILFLIIAFIHLWVDREQETEPKGNESFFPFVTVQVVSFNDPIAKRCVEMCLDFDYPKDKFEVMIVDDSTDNDTVSVLSSLQDKYPDMVRFVHRDNREGYKPGALRDAMHLVKGEFIAIFDSDFEPTPDFLKKIVAPFKDDKIGIVQARQGFSNDETNLVARFAADLLRVHHTILMPINNHVNSVFFCGTAGAIRKKAIVDAGGWNASSITEDTDLSIKILDAGYKNVYIKLEIPSEVPVTLEGWLKQQMRWTFGNFRAFLDYKGLIFNKKFSLAQKFMITFMTTGTIIAPVVMLMTIAGLLSWFFGDPQLFAFSQVYEFVLKFFYTSGFLFLVVITLVKQKDIRSFPKVLLGTFSLSIILAGANSFAAYRAIFHKDKPLYKSKNNSWICTPKVGNDSFNKVE